MEKPFVLSVNFDGTIVKHRYPEIGPEVPHAIRVLKWLQSLDVRIVLNTTRSDSSEGLFLTQAIEWLLERGIELWGIKIEANIYVDQAGYGMPLIYPENDLPYVDWLEIEQGITKNIIVYKC